MTSRTTPTAGPGHETAEQPRGEPQRRTLRRMAVVVRDDGYDRLLTPLAFAYGQARRGVQVDLLFVLWAVRVLTTEGVATPRVTGQHADEAAWLRDRLRSGGEPVEIHDLLRGLKATGNARLFGCRLAARTFDVEPGDLLPEADGIVDPDWFLNEKALAADHCQYF